PPKAPLQHKMVNVSTSNARYRPGPRPATWQTMVPSSGSLGTVSSKRTRSSQYCHAEASKLCRTVSVTGLNIFTDCWIHCLQGATESPTMIGGGSSLGVIFITAITWPKRSNNFVTVCSEANVRKRKADSSTRSVQGSDDQFPI